MDKKPDKEKKGEKGKSHPPGADYVEAEKKPSRRSGKNKNKPTDAGPSSNVPPPSSAQPSNEPGPSSQRLPPSTGTAQPPAAKGARRPTQPPGQPSQANLSSTRPAQSSAQTGTRESTQASSKLDPAHLSEKPINTETSSEREGFEKEQSISNPINASSGAKPPIEKHQARPGGTGVLGNKVYLSTNYFRLTATPDLKLHRYSITVWPEVKGKKLAQMIKDALALPEFDDLRPGIVSDFAAVLISPHSLPDNLLKVSVPYQKERSGKDSEDAKPPSNARNPSDAEDPSDVEDLANRNGYYVKFDFKREVDDFSVRNIQESTADQGNLPLVQDLDIILGHHRKSSSDITMIGKRKAFQMQNQWRADGTPLKDPKQQNLALLLALRGFFSSVRLSTDEILVNVNVSHGTFYLQNDLQSMFALIRNHPQVHATKIPGLLKGLRVQLTHLEPKEVFRTILGFAAPGQGNGCEPHPPKVSAIGAKPREVKFFEYKSTKPAMRDKDKEKAKNGELTAHDPSQCGCDGSYISVHDYFKRQYPSHQISDGFPVVNVGSFQHPSYLPLSACYVDYQPAKLKLAPDETAIMQKFAVRTPYLNAESIKTKGFPTLGLETGNPKLTTIGISIDPNRLTLDGRILPQPTVMFRDKKGFYNGKSQWNLGGMKFGNSNELRTWACLNIHTGKTPSSCHDLCVDNFLKVLKACGITASTPTTTHLRTNELNTGKLEQFFRDFSPNSSDIPILLVVLPDNSSQLYNQIKFLGDRRYGILTICVVGSEKKFYNTATYKREGTVVSRAIQYNANVALKVNIKNDGVNHELKSLELGFIGEGKTMVVGIDVTHPSPGSGSNASSVAAMVASSAGNLAQWPAELRVNPARQEKVDMLRPMLQLHLQYWEQKNGSLPENLLIYRDGVSEGQYQMVLDEELPQLRQACEFVYGDDYKRKEFPRITLIVVGKRHHTRFYRTHRITGEILVSDEGKDGNPPFGTVVDTGVVDTARNWDFYIQSHTALHGTARPAHYFVLLDEIFSSFKTLPNPYKNASDYLQGITHNMCYLFCRATTSVSIPPPVYYADIACERARRWNSRVFDPSQSEIGGGNEILDKDVKVNARIAKRMFYI